MTQGRGPNPRLKDAMKRIRLKTKINNLSISIPNIEIYTHEPLFKGIYIKFTLQVEANQYCPLFPRFMISYYNLKLSNMKFD